MRGVTVLLSIVALTLAGCASYPTDQCAATDWRAQGYADGLNGRAATHYAAHRQGCAKVGVIPDQDAYEAGRVEGVAEYCTPQNGYRAGRGGRAYEGVCPANTSTEFFDAYEHGRRYRQIANSLRRLEREFYLTDYYSGFYPGYGWRSYRRGYGRYHPYYHRGYSRSPFIYDDIDRMRGMLSDYDRWPPSRN